VVRISCQVESVVNIVRNEGGFSQKARVALRATITVFANKNPAKESMKFLTRELS
jgi:hypothetical protein